MPGVLPNLNQFIPDLMLLVVVTWALNLRWQWSIPLAFFSGLTLNLLNPSTKLVGVDALLYTFIALLVGLIARQPENTGLARAILITLGAALLYRILLLLVQQFMGYNNLQLNLLIQVILPVAIVDAALMLIVFVVVRFLSRIGAPIE